MRFHDFRTISVAAAVFLPSLATSDESAGSFELPDFAVNWAQRQLGANGSDSRAASGQSSFFGLFERQLSCDPGYGYCSNLGACCPSADKCCDYGYCLPPNDVCCDGGACPSGWSCCEVGTCYPNGGQCCADGNYCTPGNICVLIGATGQHACCTNLQCTAHVDGGTTIYATTQVPAANTGVASTARTTNSNPPATTPATTPAPTTTATEAINFEYYTWTVTWWYWYYYWTVDYVIATTSTVTSSQVTTTTSIIILASDSADATLSLSQLSSSVVQYTPVEATLLQSVASVEATSHATSTSATSTLRATGTSGATNTVSGLQSGATTLVHSGDGLWLIAVLVVGLVIPGIGMIAL